VIWALIILGIVVIVYLLKHDAKNADIANQNLVSTGHNAILAAVEQQLLIKHLGVKRAAKVLLDAVENEPEAYPILKRLYEQANLNYDHAHSDPKSRAIVLRTLETSMQNTLDLMGDEIDNS
jgi:hypothetical protein